MMRFFIKNTEIQDVIVIGCVPEEGQERAASFEEGKTLALENNWSYIEVDL
eukprot:CAMPEP_0170560064 /NCGR_PEP_ID=MMETSP0211-20121228/46804_1 /TAXON_ID=311385 /ORGANISM="Pseudokeronopsis sp., Strain OXSARD2" /LENGTH=50 /DNA_ID=CAMNT_0010873845 /DNA_START=187 /DNA_END=336 /DNA_ORIENTATION=-